MKSTPGTKTISIGNKKLVVKIADTDAKRKAGLSGVEKVEGYDGMLFIFQDKTSQSFWNKDTLLDLDIVWISGFHVADVDSLLSEGRVGTKTIDSPGPIDMVLELPAGRAQEFGAVPGALVSIPPELKLR